jgi:hypothetical protein
MEDYIRAEALQKLRMRRLQAEDSGIQFKGIRVPTDAYTRQLMTGAMLALQKAPVSRNVQWRVGNGQKVPLTLKDLQDISALVLEHIERCFDREEELKAEIMAYPIRPGPRHRMKVDVDIEAGWP